MRSIAAVLFSALLAGCSSTVTPSPSPSSTRSQPVSQIASPHASVPSPSLVLCNPSTVDVPEAGWSGAGGVMARGFLLCNIGTTPCLASDPWRSASVMPARRHSWWTRSDPSAVPRRTRCSCPGCRSLPTARHRAATTRPVSLVVDLGAAVERTVRVVDSGSIPRCDAPGAPSVLNV